VRVEGTEVVIPSSKHRCSQRAIFYAPAGAGVCHNPAPLLVALHTWSAGFDQEEHWKPFLDECKQRGWAFVHPDFRGPNNRPEACASYLAVDDVLDAVEYSKRNASVDGRRVYAAGASGGGHMALMMACRAPQIWAGVSAWVPVTDLAAWHRECCRSGRLNYRRDLERVCGGAPGTRRTDAKYRSRSPLFHLASAKGVPISISAGIYDGHTGSVPISHALNAFNALADANGFSELVISEEQIAFMVREARIPDDLAGQREEDASLRFRVLLRRSAGPVRVTIFDGGHETDPHAACEWLAGSEKRHADLGDKV
jgi:dipeptidyl aminopeptidase/acylaminoacyl peptidase